VNIYEKLLEVRKSVTYLQKGEKGSQYSYVSSSQVLSAVRKKMDDVGLLLIPEITGMNVREKQETKQGGKITVTYFTELFMKMTWVNCEKSEEKVECEWYAQGVDIAGEKGVGKALTYAEKYFILKSFNIATDNDDPDAFQKKNDPPPPSTAKKKGNIHEAINLIDTCHDTDQLKKMKEFLNDFSWEEFEIQELVEKMRKRSELFTEGGN